MVKSNQFVIALMTDIHIQFIFCSETINSERYFYINYKWGGCIGDIGWLQVSDIHNLGCPYERSLRYPAFLYSTVPTESNWHNSTGGLNGKLVAC